ncbi:hypothetical protein [Sulfitobacter pontiacus]|uniref:hypothetical protein n=1 Tax=Sulfitobacter pontiacus TaxID=60137 RepID=UPI004058C173
MTKILILDDNLVNAEDWRDSISNTLNGTANLETVKLADAAAHIEKLLTRQRAARNSEDFDREESIFDEVDILIVDYDLVHISEGHGRFTGEGICRLVQAYSGCGQVVILNQFVEADFDLSQRGNPSSSHADLNISSAHVANRGLWKEDGWEDFRPWHWPVLPDAAVRHKELRELISSNPNAALLPLLGFTEELAQLLTDDAVGFIAPEARTIADLMKVTLSDFLQGNSHAVDHRDGKVLCENEIQYRFGLAASRLTKWLKRMVVGPRNLILDLPHLIERYPFLLPPEKIADTETWKELTIGVPDWFKGRVPDQAWAQSRLWSRVPHVWMPLLEEDAAFQELRYDFDYSSAPELVFAEDHSRFLSIDDAKMFKAEFNNEFDRRFVKGIAGVKYAPKRRFAL